MGAGRRPQAGPRFQVFANDRLCRPRPFGASSAVGSRATRAASLALLLAAPLAISIDSVAQDASASFIAAPQLIPSGARRPCPPQMRLVPGGTVEIKPSEGDDEAGRPTHLVQVPTFCMDVTEVSQATYEQCAKAGSCVAAHTSCYDFTDKRDYTDNCPCNSGVPDRQDHPANCIDVHESEAYCRAQGKRLPTEAEWQYAAGGGSLHTKYPWGNTEPEKADSADVDKLLCWSASYSRQTTCPIGAYPAGDSPVGIKDLAGGVYEWTASRGGSEFSDCGGGSDCYVYRGGAAFTSTAIYVDVSYRTADPGLDRWSGVGFRCVR